MDGSRFIDDAARATMLHDAEGADMSRVRAMVIAVFLALSAHDAFELFDLLRLRAMGRAWRISDMRTQAAAREAR